MGFAAKQLHDRQHKRRDCVPHPRQVMRQRQASQPLLLEPRARLLVLLVLATAQRMTCVADGSSTPALEQLTMSSASSR
jgi:hypothetical protein